MPIQRRILILNERDSEHPRAGGAETHVREIFSRLADRGHVVHQYSAGFADAPRRVDHAGSGIRVERVSPLLRYYASVPDRLLRAGRRGEFDIVVECLNKVPFYAPIWTSCPVLALCHHLFGDVAFSQVSAPLASLVWLAERGLPNAYRRSRFLAISESTRDDLIRRGIHPDRIDVSHPGINRPRRAVHLNQPRPRRITYLGRLEAYKNIEILFEAAVRLVDRYPDLEICVIGRGPARASLERLAASLGLESRTRFEGYIDDDARDELLSMTRACVFPSDKEGWGLTVIEANALGTPVVANDAPGLRDSVRHEETGLLVPSLDPVRFAEALGRLLEDSDSARAMREAAYAWSQRFDWEDAAHDMEAAIERSIRDHDKT